MNPFRTSRPSGRPDGDILQVGIVGTQATRNGNRLAEGRMDSACVGIDQFWQRIHIGRLQLFDPAKGQDFRRQFVRIGKLGQRRLIRHILPGFGLFLPWPPLPSSSLSNMISPNCLGELMLNSCPASS